MGRVINAEPYLKNLLKEEDKYYIGFGVRNLTTLGLHYPEIQELIKGNVSDLLLRGKSGPLKENINGKMVRKQPEQKVSEMKHIKYTKRDGTHVEFDRLFHIWEKEMLHNYNLKLFRAKSPQDEVILHFPLLTMENSQNHYLFVKAQMNLSNILGGYFQIYNQNFEPIIKTTATFGRKILEKGIGSVKTKLDDIKDSLSKGIFEHDDSGNSYRFAILRDYNITDVYDGKGGFNEYFQFEFASDDIVILENLRSGNATYIFRLSKYDKDFVLDKQTAPHHNSFLKRVIHHDIKDWEQNIASFLNKNRDEDQVLLVE